MAKAAIVNAPSSFTFIWSIIKPWLAKETVEKFDILGSDYQEALLELIDAENLPTTLGGKCTCPDAGGCDLSGAGPWMDDRNTGIKVVNIVSQVDVNGVRESLPPNLKAEEVMVSEQTVSTLEQVVA